MSKKEWIGKIHIYIHHRNINHSFCWMSMAKDASLFFGFTSNTIKFTEYGSSTVRAGYFTDHTKILRRGNLDISKTNKPHISFHPPTIAGKSGIAHMLDCHGKVDEWDLDWYPVHKPQALLFAYSGDIAKLDEVTELKGNGQVVNAPDNVHCLRMQLFLHPIPKSPTMIGRSDTLTNIMGFCPNYIVCCHFDSVNVVEPAVYIATDSYSHI